MRRLRYILNLKDKPFSCNRALVANLAPAFRIERRTVQNNRNPASFFRSLNQLVILNDRNYISLCQQFIIANKFTFNRKIAKRSALHLHAARILTCRARALTLPFHRRIKAGAIYRHAVLNCKILSQIKREAIRIV
ncbi:hypothetical protein D3C78_808580 [compost metagenome]